METILAEAMSVNQTSSELLQLDNRVGTGHGFLLRRWVRAGVVLRVVAIAAVLVLAGGGTVDARETRARTYMLAVAGYGFDLLAWEAGALSEKLTAAFAQPGDTFDTGEAAQSVVAYISRADRIGELEDQITGLSSVGESQEDGEMLSLQTELGDLRAVQSQTRIPVEQTIERQVSAELDKQRFTLLGFPFPPVQFTFTEPPKKLIISPRDRILTEDSRMLAPDMTLGEIEQAEAQIDDDRVRSYITNIGGLGAFPTMVVDRASLGWILSTVAHEWTHNYLAFYPLGWSYFKSQDMTTLNESVAEIVGNEIGAQAEERFYAGLESEPTLDAGEDASEDSERPRIPMWEALMEREARFDFRAEMRETRLTVDRLLADGRVDEAEQYMEERRQLFVAHGYPLRVLNQAYFAFHGSYGTSAASTSPIGPKLNELRSLTPDLATFLKTVRWFTSVGDLDHALDQWTSHAHSATS
jgi:hypothetical protein